MTEPAYQGVILAAGQGARMGPFGEEVPKPVVPICNKPLLAYHLEHMRRFGIEEVIVVIGHLGHVITRTLGDGEEYGVRLRYVEQDQRLGIAHAVGQVEPFIDRPFLLILGDIFFEVPGLRAMAEIMEQKDATAVVAVKEEENPEAVKRNFSVLLNDDETVRRVIEKPRHVPNLLKGCGIYLFGLPIFDAIRRTPRTAMRDEYELTDSIQILIDYEYPVHVGSVVEWDMNITYVGDLIDCCRHQLRRLGVTRLTGPGCQIAEGTELSETVVGDGAVIAKPARLERCVVLPGVTLADGLDYSDTVFTSRGRLTAGHNL